MKTCNCCKKNFPLEDFAFKNKAKGIRINFCSICRKKKSRDSYYNHHEKNLERVKLRKKTNSNWYSKLKQNLSCCVCGESEPECLDFHHINSDEKESDVNKLRNYSKEKLIGELNKCACLCANCHRKYHAGKLNALLVKLEIITEYDSVVVGSSPTERASFIAE